MLQSLLKVSVLFFWRSHVDCRYGLLVFNASAEELLFFFVGRFSLTSIRTVVPLVQRIFVLNPLCLLPTNSDLIMLSTTDYIPGIAILTCRLTVQTYRCLLVQAL